MTIPDVRVVVLGVREVVSILARETVLVVVMAAVKAGAMAVAKGVADELKNFRVNRFIMEFRDITLCIIESCNLSCTYCYENHKSSKKMSFDIARQIIDYEMSVRDKFDGVMFNLFGGEAFLNFELIKQIVNYLESNYRNSDLKWHCFITTNGTLVHGEIQKYLREHRCSISCGLSLDGTKECHNKNRSNSFDDIDVSFFAEFYRNQHIKMTISAETLPQLSECVIFAHDLGFIVSCNLAYGIDWSKSDNVKILEKELLKLISYYLEHPNITPCSMLNEPIYKVALRKKEARRECGAGQYMRAYDTNGVSYSCQFFMPLSIGAEAAKKSLDIQWHDEVIPEDKLDSRCRDCVLKSCCHICYGSNYASTGNIYLHEENWCKLNKIIFKARAYFRVKQFEKGLLSGSEVEQKATLKSAMIILENL